MNRIVWVDWAKALLILFMVVGHYASPDILKQYIYAFHMPAFFVISGYLYKPKVFYKTLLAYLVPLFIFGLINYLFEIIVNYHNGNSYVFSIDDIWDIPTYFPGFWFIRTLLLLRLFSGDIIYKKIEHIIGGGAFALC